MRIALGAAGTAGERRRRPQRLNGRVGAVAVTTLSLSLRREWLPGWLHAGEILRTVKHGDDLQELLVVNAIDYTVAAKDDFANRVLMASLGHGAATARHGRQPLDGVDQALGKLACIERRILRDVIAQLRQLTLGARRPLDLHLRGITEQAALDILMGDTASLVQFLQPFLDLSISSRAACLTLCMKITSDNYKRF